MKRTLFIFATAVSFVLFVMVIVLGVGSFWTARFITWQRRTEQPLTADDRPSGVEAISATSKMLGVKRSVGVARGTVRCDELLTMHYVFRWQKHFKIDGAERPVWAFDSVAADQYEPLARRAFWVGFADRDDGFAGKLPKDSYRMAAIPLWPAVVVTGILPGAWVRRASRRRKRRAMGLCLNCGYDMRASTRCPECGREGEPRSHEEHEAVP